MRKSKPISFYPLSAKDYKKEAPSCMGTVNFMINVMISYSHKDQSYANMLVSILEQNKIACWIDYRDATPGINYAGSIVHAIKNADLVVVILSSNSMTSGQVLNEINVAVNNEKMIIPFKIDDEKLNDSMEYYLSKTHWLNAITPPLEAHINRLVDTIQKTTDKASCSDRAQKAPNPPSASTFREKSSCRMVKFGELIELGYTASKIATQLVENDYINCNGIGDENEGTAEQWEEILQSNSDTFQYLINQQNEIIGDWSIVALNEETYELARKGQLHESDIDESNTELICFPDTYSGYILSISILPQYRTAENFNLLVESFLSQLEEYSEQGIFFKRWCINVFSKEVEALVKRMGFTYQCDNKTFGKIYCCEFIPLPRIPLLKKHPKLIENYENL